MKAFSITYAQIGRVVGSAIADEVSRQSTRHFDLLTVAAWNDSTMLGGNGIGLSEEEIEISRYRIAQTFGQPVGVIIQRPNPSLGEWVEDIKKSLANSLTKFAFKAAVRDEKAALCVHQADHLYNDAAGVAGVFYGRRRLLSFMAPHSLLGFVTTILTPNLQNIDSIDARGMAPEDLAETLAYGDVLVATPTWWRYIIGEDLKAPDNAMAVSFGEPISQELAANMRKAGFGALRELYGSTETGLVGWRDAPGEPFILFDNWKNSEGVLTRVCPDGQMMAADLKDKIQWSGPRSFMLGGRRDGAIQIGAVNVFPHEIADKMKEHPQILDCQIQAGKRGDGVNRLVAHIVLNDGITPQERFVREIDAWCRAALRPQERPCIYHFERTIKKSTANGIS